MRKYLLATAALLLAAGAANAVTITGTYTATLSGGNASLVSNLSSPFSLTAGDSRSLFLTVDPNGSCMGSCNPVVGLISVAFSNLTANGHNFGGFTETGVYSAFYGTQVDNVIWNGATAQAGSWIGLDQDGSVPLVFTKALNGGSFGILDFNLIDGADWNVQTYAEASLSAVPGPIVGAGLPGIIAACFGLLGLNIKRRRRQLAIQ